MRIPVIAGNWKMNNTIEESRTLVYELSSGLKEIINVEKIIFPPFISLLPVAALLQGTDIGLGAQNLHWEAKGAYTGEISARMIAEFCKYVIIGHSERRMFFLETDEIVNKKIFSAIRNDLNPVVCIGETLGEKESGQTEAVLGRQINQGLKNLDKDQISSVIIAYEPVWAIGTGRASSGENANDVIRKIIRPALRNLFDLNTADSTRILYGGSVTPTNAADFFAYADIDGALVGGASLKADDFIKITRACVR
jgi:triosephosphate isomerase